ncbi:MAG: hypothetical protein V2A62_02895 [Candidatus Woesearchaeota archaeon]
MAEKEGSNGKRNGNGLSAYEFGKIGVTHTEHKAEVSLWLDSYTDLFSDFDSRPFSNRAMSQDFLDEAKRATKDLEPGKFSFKLLMPEKLRVLSDEKVIKRRLKEHFQKHHDELEGEQRMITYKGMALAVLGFLLMIAAALVTYQNFSQWWAVIIVTIFEPAGWFTLWFGLDHVFYFKKQKKPEYLFYERMNGTEISFGSY